MTRGWAAALALALTCLAPAAAAEDGPTSFQGILDGVNERMNADETDDESAPTALPTLPSGLVLDAEATEAAQRAVQAYYEYNRDGFDHRARVFAWQHLSSRVIFAAVMLVVAIGLYFSWTQFHASDRGRDLAPSALEASGDGFKLSSPVLGVIILALSLGFFYLYLVHVYPITDAI